jgi:peptidoglycan hydrolase CwlO-like protein
MQSLESKALKISNSIGSVPSLIIHTIFFIAVISSTFFGVDVEKALLVLTTVVSLEAIYLSIFIQMSVNKNTRAIETVEKDIEELSEDVEEISEDVQEIGVDVEEIQKDVDEIQEDVQEISEDIDEIQEDVEEIQKDVDEIQEDVEEISEEMDDSESDKMVNKK